MKIELEVEFAIGASVLFMNKIGRDEGTVTGYSVRKGSIMYIVCWSDKKEGYHYGFEITTIR